RDLGIFVELDIQSWALGAPGFVMDIANWTYFNCQFSITMAFLLWVYSQRNWAWPTVRDVMLATYLVGLLGYIFYPTAPPRMFPELGFVDTLASTSLSHESEGVSLLANPYAAMPSLHTATAILL